jgi:hypothetical protein
MEQYKNWSPTQFDCKGLGIPDRQNWFVAPVIYSKHTDDCLAHANFDAMLKALGGESETVEVHAFNHWVSGFDIILISDQDAEKLKLAEEIENALSDYPVIDDELFSQYEMEEQWNNCKTANSELTKEIEDRFNITDLDLTDDAIESLIRDEFITFSGENWPELKFELHYSKKELTLEHLMSQACLCTFTFPDDFDFYSNAHTDNLNATLFKALAYRSTHGYTYKMENGDDIEIPTWAYPNPNQLSLPIEK